MDNRPVVVLLGDSLFLEGVAMSLADRQRLGVVYMDSFGTDIQERLKSLKPKLIVFELDGPRSPAIFSLLKERPGTLLLGLDLDHNQVLLLKSRQHLAHNMKELCQLVQVHVA